MGPLHGPAISSVSRVGVLGVMGIGDFSKSLPPLAPGLIGVECYKFYGILPLLWVSFTKNSILALLVCVLWRFFKIVTDKNSEGQNFFPLLVPVIIGVECYKFYGILPL